MKKKCSKCKKLFLISGFYKDCCSSDGLHSQCKNCMKVYQTTHKKECNERQRKWSDKNRKKVRAIARKSYYKNHNKVLEYHRRWRKENPEKFRLIQQKAWKKSIARETGKDAKQKYPNKDGIRWMIHHALVLGILKKPACCESCNTFGYVEAHHHKGYDAEHVLDVRWLCEKCHGKEDKVYRNMARSG